MEEPLDIWTPEFREAIEALAGSSVSTEALLASMTGELANAYYSAMTGATREEVMRQAREHAAKLVTQVSEGVKQQIAEIVAQGLEQQLGHVGTARLIRDSIGLDSNRAKALAKFRAEKEAAGLSGPKLDEAVARQRRILINERAKTIAQNEMGSAVERASLASAIASGDYTHKLSLTVGDAFVSEICIENAAAGPIPIDDDYPSGDPCPQFHVSCRCTQVFINEADKEEFAFYQQEAKDREEETRKRIEEEKKGEQ